MTGMVFQSCNKDDDDATDNNNNTAAETYTISGILFDRETNETISNAYITFDDRTTAISASDGSYETQISTGSRLISVFAENFMIFSSVIEVSSDFEFDVPLEYVEGLGSSGVVTGNVDSESNNQLTVRGEGFYVQADENGFYSLRLPVGENRVYAIDQTGISNFANVSVIENSTTSVDLATDQTGCYFNTDNFIEKMTTLESCEYTKLGYYYYGLYRSSQSISCIQKMVYEFSNGSPEVIVYPDQEAMDYDDWGELHFWLKCQPLFGETITATVYFNDETMASQTILHPGFYGTGYNQQYLHEYPLENHYCNYEGGPGGNSGENEITIISIDPEYPGTYNCELNTGNYGIDVIDDEFGMWFTTTDGKIETYIYIEEESIPDGDFTLTLPANSYSLDFEIEMDEDETGVSFYSGDCLGSVYIKRTGDTWEVSSEQTDDEGNTLIFSYEGTLDLIPDWG